MYRFGASGCRFRISDSFTDVVTIMVKPNVGNFQSAVQITRSRRKRHSVCACPSDLGPKETLVTTLEDDFTALDYLSFFNNLFIWICFQVQSPVSFAWGCMAIEFITAVWAIVMSIAALSRLNTRTIVASPLVISAFPPAIILVRSIAAVYPQITSSGIGNALTGVTPELAPGASTISFIRLISAVWISVAHQVVRNALSIATGELR